MSKLKRLFCLALAVLALMSCAAMPAWAEGEESSPRARSIT